MIAHYYTEVTMHGPNNKNNRFLMLNETNYITYVDNIRHAQCVKFGRKAKTDQVTFRFFNKKAVLLQGELRDAAVNFDM